METTISPIFAYHKKTDPLVVENVCTEIISTIRFDALCLDGTLWTYLADLNERAQHRLEVIIEQMKASEGVTEALKANDQMAWTGVMNSIRNRAEEIVLTELIYEEDVV